MDVRRQEVKISFNLEMQIWELRYSNHPRVISYSANYMMLDDFSEIIIKNYFGELNKTLVNIKSYSILN